MGSFAGALAGVGERAHEENLLTLQREHEARTNVINMALKSLESMPEDRQGPIMQELVTFTSDPKYKAEKFAKKLGEFWTTPVERPTTASAMQGQVPGPSLPLGNPPSGLTSQAVAPPPPPPYAGPVPAPPTEPIQANPPMAPVAAPPIPPPPDMAIGKVVTGTERISPYAAHRGEAMANELARQRGLTGVETERAVTVSKASEQAKREAELSSAQELNRLMKTDPQLAQAYMIVSGKGGMLAPKNIPGTVPGSELAKEMTVDSLGQPIDPNRNYRVTRDFSGKAATAYPDSKSGFDLKSGPDGNPIYVQGPDGTKYFGKPTDPPAARELFENAKKVYYDALDQKEQRSANATSNAIQKVLIGQDLSQTKSELNSANQGANKSFTTYQQAKTRLRAMESAAKEAEGTQKGGPDMVLITQHLGMTVGDVKGMRTGKDILEQHETARSLPENVKVWFSKWKTGDKLSPEQRAVFISLGRDRLRNAEQEYQANKERIDSLREGFESKLEGYGLKKPSAKAAKIPEPPGEKSQSVTITLPSGKKVTID